MEVEMEADIAKTNEISDNIRERNRKCSQANRKFLRIENQNTQRVGLGEIQTLFKDLDNLTEKDVRALTARIKRRKGATEEDMNRLNCALLQSMDNITAFIKTPGAINIIVRELIGKNVVNQILACEFLCNLSLGDEICCEKIAIYSGLYLVLYLGNCMNSKLQITCLWTIQNLAATGKRALKILLFQKVLSHVLTLINDSSLDSEITDEATRTLNIVVQGGSNLFSCDDINKIIMTLSKFQHFNNVDAIHTLFSISTIDSLAIELDRVKEFVAQCSWNIIKLHQKTYFLNDDIRIYLLSIRVIFNLAIMDNEALMNFFTIITSSNIKLTELFNKITELKNEALMKEILWFYAHIHKCASAIGNEILHNENFFQDLKVPRNIID